MTACCLGLIIIQQHNMSIKWREKACFLTKNCGWYWIFLDNKKALPLFFIFHYLSFFYTKNIGTRQRLVFLHSTNEKASKNNLEEKFFFLNKTFRRYSDHRSIPLCTIDSHYIEHSWDHFFLYFWGVLALKNQPALLLELFQHTAFRFSHHWLVGLILWWYSCCLCF